MKCRICGDDLYKFLSLGEMPLVNSFLKKEQMDKNEPKFPLNACLCNKCGLVQLDHLVLPDMMYKNYIYFSSTSDLLKRHFSELADEVAERFLQKDSFVVEIASNDGIVLRNFKRIGMRVLGIEPATNIARYANENGIETLNEYWSSDVAKRIATVKGKADAILANNVIGHVHDLHDFARGISLLLKNDGVAVIQVQYLIDLIEKLEYDTIYHEHVSYISLHPAVHLFAQYGLHVFDIRRFPDIHGGSIRFYIKMNPKKEKSVRELMEYENKMGFLSRGKYDKFARKVEIHRTQFKEMLQSIKSEGKHMAGYGAAAKANTMLNYCGIGPDTIEYIADKSEHKQNLFTPGMHIPVVRPEKIFEDMPDYVVILAWNFAEEIMEQLKRYSEKGGKFIIPVPEPRIVR